MTPVERIVRGIDRFQQRHLPFAFAVGVMKKFGDDNAGTLVSSLAYASFLAVFPLLLVLVTILGIILAGHPGFRESVLHSTFADFPLVGQKLATNITGLHRDSVTGLVVGLVGLVWGSIGLAQAGLFSMAQVWNLPGPQRLNYPKRLLRSLAFLSVLGVGIATSSFLAAFGTFGDHNVLLGVLGELAAAAVNLGQYLLAFRVLTPRVIATRDLVPGALVGGVAWTLLLALGGYLIGHDLRNDSEVYGVFGAVLGLLAWVYLGAQISIYCAELNTVIKRHLWPRALIQPPLTAADQCSMALQATENQRRPEQRVTVSFSQNPTEESGTLSDGGASTVSPIDQ